VRQYCSDKYSLCVEVDRGNQAQFVSSDIEHKYIAHFVGAGKERSQLRKIVPLGFFAKAIPLLQRTGTLRMRLLCRHNPAMCDYVHKIIISQKEISLSIGNIFVTHALRASPFPSSATKRRLVKEF
jgi:hypothetical protein